MRIVIIVETGPAVGRRWLLRPGDRMVFGRTERADIVIAEDLLLSSCHFRISIDGDDCQIEDLQSTNGTFLDGAEIREAYIRAGAVIAAGAAELKFSPFEERIQILPSEKEKLGVMVGRSLKMRQIFGLVERIAQTDATVLIEGETGTGKDILARSIHQLSRRKDAPFVVVDCAAVSGTLIESELFGHIKGSFTGAIKDKIGRFEQAHGGTIFLDEIGDISPALQVRLLRVLQNKEIERVGGTSSVKLNIRIIAATNRNLEEMISNKTFREDLWFRLNVFPIYVPSLRERRVDIPAFVFKITR